MFSKEKQTGLFGFDSFGSKAKKGNESIKVNPFQEDLKDLFDLTKNNPAFATSLPDLIGDWKGTARVKELLQFGLNYHSLGSLREAVLLWSPQVKTESVDIRFRSGSVKGDLFGIIGRRELGKDKAVFDCVVATDDGYTLVSMMRQDADSDLRFVFHKGFTPGTPKERTIEEAVRPLSKGSK